MCKHGEPAWMFLIGRKGAPSGLSESRRVCEVLWKVGEETHLPKLPQLTP